jgi:hypothetical protein
LVPVDTRQLHPVQLRTGHNDNKSLALSPDIFGHQWLALTSGLPLMSQPIALPLFSMRCFVLSWCGWHNDCQLDSSQNSCKFPLCGLMWSTTDAERVWPSLSQ